MSIPNSLTSRDTSYIVYPTDLTDTDQIIETEAFLWDLYGKDHVKVNRNQAGPISWTISSKNDESVDQLKEHKGIRLAEEVAIPDQSKRSDIHRRDNPVWIARVVDPDNLAQIDATRAFVKSKVTNPDRYIIELHLRKKVYGWGQLELDDAAKAEVEAYVGVKSPLRKDGPMTQHLVAGYESRSGIIK